MFIYKRQFECNILFNTLNKARAAEHDKCRWMLGDRDEDLCTSPCPVGCMTPI